MQVVLVLESTANMADSFDELLTRYLDPMLSQLKANFGLVLFGDYESFHRSTVKVMLEQSQLDKLKSILQKLKFGSGGLLKNATVEGIAAGIQILNLNSNEEKHLILITNSSCHSIGCRFSQQFKGLNMQRIAQFLNQHKIHVSLISARKHIKEIEEFIHAANSFPLQEVPHQFHSIKLSDLSIPNLNQQAVKRSTEIVPEPSKKVKTETVKDKPAAAAPSTPPIMLKIKAPALAQATSTVAVPSQVVSTSHPTPVTHQNSKPQVSSAVQSNVSASTSAIPPSMQHIASGLKSTISPSMPQAVVPVATALPISQSATTSTPIGQPCIPTNLAGNANFAQQMMRQQQQLSAITQQSLNFLQRQQQTHQQHIARNQVIAPVGDSTQMQQKQQIQQQIQQQNLVNANNFAAMTRPQSQTMVSWNGMLSWMGSDPITGQVKELQCTLQASPASKNITIENYFFHLWPPSIRIAQVAQINPDIIQRMQAAGLPAVSFLATDPSNMMVCNSLVNVMTQKNVAAVIRFVPPQIQQQTLHPQQEASYQGLVMFVVNQRLLGYVFIQNSLKNFLTLLQASQNQTMNLQQQMQIRQPQMAMGMNVNMPNMFALNPQLAMMQQQMQNMGNPGFVVPTSNGLTPQQQLQMLQRMQQNGGFMQ